MSTMSQNSVGIDEWVKMFPGNMTLSKTDSATFMKQLSVIAVSTITYLKSAFPESNYRVEKFAGLKLKILKNQCNHDLAQFVCDALHNAFEAFDKKYLHKLAICFYKDSYLNPTDNLIDCYIFEYTYHDNDVSIKIHNKSNATGAENEVGKVSLLEVQNSTVTLIRSCLVMMQLAPKLPDIYDISIKLYYNEDAPDGYQAPGFMNGKDSDELETAAKDSTNCLKIGTVRTPFHRVAFHSYCKDGLEDSNVAIASEGEQEELTQLLEQHPRSDSMGTSPHEEYTVKCACNNYTDLRNQTPLMVKCRYCKLWQHAVCYGLQEGDGEMLDRHCCCSCTDQDPTRPATDARLSATKALKQRESICVFRRTLMLCTELDTVDAAYLRKYFAISQGNTNKILNLLELEHVITAASEPSASRKIIVENLAGLFRIYFYSENKNLARRLREGAILKSQQGEADLINEVLSPLEKASLQNASQILRVIEKPNVPKRRNTDETMKQFRDVVMKDSDHVTEEMPLSGSHNPVKDLKEIITEKSLKKKAASGQNRKVPVKLGVQNRSVKRRKH